LGHGYSLEEDLLRVPLVMKGPGVPVATVEDQVRHVDIAPTILDLCGAVPSTPLDGRSLVVAMRGEGLAEAAAYAELGVSGEGSGTIAVRKGGYKLLRMRGGELRLHHVAGVYRGDGTSRADDGPNLISSEPAIADDLKAEMDRVLESRSDVGSGMSEDEEAEVEKHLRSLGYL
jgi:uncharacterized sulfatase